MTIPALTNCPHSGDGWCLACVAALAREAETLREQRLQDMDLDWRHCPRCGRYWPHVRCTSFMRCDPCRAEMREQERAEEADAAPMPPPPSRAITVRFDRVGPQPPRSSEMLAE